ncbi:hypothetical protein [Nocardioides halotolerans]|jgi:hypothetical protein|uniref:hypothetical protein n=1 Tax=Nocardioides halotolerans TaxID=433660 RepID=UPI0012F9AAC5|nr:hypothetical protein [Nocardioides halotolerans]
MRRRIPTRWLVVAFVLLGVLLALVLLIRDLRDDDTVTPEDSTLPARHALAPAPTTPGT